MSFPIPPPVPPPTLCHDHDQHALTWCLCHVHDIWGGGGGGISNFVNAVRRSTAQILRSHLETCGKDMPGPFFRHYGHLRTFFFSHLVNAVCTADHAPSEPYLHSQIKPEGMLGIFQ